MRIPEGRTMRIPEGRTILFFAPHPDDEIISSGALLQKLIENKNDIHIHFLTSGSDPAMIAIREQEAKSSSKALGASCTFHRFSRDDNVVETSKVLAETIRTLSPSLVIFPHPADDHPTHRFSHEAIRSAIAKALYCGATLEYSVWTPLASPNWAFTYGAEGHILKRGLLSHYHSQLAGHDFNAWITHNDAFNAIKWKEHLRSAAENDEGGRSEVEHDVGKYGAEKINQHETHDLTFEFAEVFRYTPAMEEPSVLCLGDIFLDILPHPFEKNVTEGTTTVPIANSLGGNAGNTAVALSRLGRETALFTVDGDDWRAGILEKVLDEAGVRQFIQRKQGMTTGTTIGVAYTDGSRHFISDFGASDKFDGDDLPILETREKRPFEHCHRAGFFWLPGLRDGTNIRVMKWCKEQGMTTSLDVGTPPSSSEGEGVWSSKDREEVQAMLPHTDIFFGNEAEVVGIAGLELDGGSGTDETIEFGVIRKAAAILLDHGVGMVVVHRGEKGASLFDADGEFHQVAPEVRIENPTGAGDVFNAAFIDAYLLNRSKKEWLAHAVAAGSLHVSDMSNPYPTWKEVDEYMDENSAIRLVTDED